MIIGIPKEIKDKEYRVSLVPSGVRALKESGHTVLVENGAGAESGIGDEEYREAGAEIIPDPVELWKRAELIVKVKEPLMEEFRHLREGLMVFTFLHLASNPALADELIRKGAIAIAYETVQTEDKRLPILTPMSEVAGRLSVQIAAHYLEKANGGEGVLLGGVPGVESGSVVILGGGVVGFNAAKVAVGLGADVTILDTDLERFRHIEDVFGRRTRTLFSNSYNIEKAVSGCDCLIGAVHIPGARTPRLVTRAMVSKMKKGSVIVDVSVDQGGSVETIRPTTHSNPTYEIDGVIHYGVSNMPGVVPRTSTFALTNVTMPYVSRLASMGFKEAVERDPSLYKGVNIHKGSITHPSVADALERPYKAL